MFKKIFLNKNFLLVSFLNFLSQRPLKKILVGVIAAFRFNYFRKKKNAHHYFR